MAEELISVIMSAYNEQEDWIRKSIESILNQTYKNLEFIIVLDNPQNEVLKNIILEYQKKDDRVILVPNEQNIGLVASLNKSLQYVHGEYVARMDADDICYLDRLEKQMEALKASGADFVTSSMDFLHEDGKLVIGISDEDFGSKEMAEIMKYGNVAHHNTWLMKKEVYDSMKGYREVSYCEDAEFVLRALQAGVKIVKTHHHVIQYRLRESSVSRSYTMEQTMKARYIRQKYVDGERINDIPPAELNQRFSGYTDAQKQKFNRADRILTAFGQNMAAGKWVACMKCFLQGFFPNGYFRMLFIEYFKSWYMRKKLNK